MNGILIRSGVDTETRPREDGGRDWTYTAMSHRMSGATRHWKGQGSIIPQNFRVAVILILFYFGRIAVHTKIHQWTLEAVKKECSSL